MKTWLITGSNRGIGLEIARAALEAGDEVIAASRKPDHVKSSLRSYGERLHAIGLDVTSSSVEGALVEELARFDRVDVLVNNAGYGQLGAFEEITPHSVAQQFATNVFGVFAVTRAVLPLMRAARNGHIITISSIAGIEGFPGSSIYCATKHAVSGWSEALSNELAPLGINVTCVYPGRFRTDFLDASSVRHGDITLADYSTASLLRREALDNDNHRQLGDPIKLAAAIVEIVESQHPPIRFAAGSDAYACFLRVADRISISAEATKELSLGTDFSI
jgi:NAD(P)-dependent dehydrogenase (short-subunit alcohol dehydrogenase family)